MSSPFAVLARKWSGIRALPSAERRLFFIAACGLPVVALAVQWWGLRRTQGALARMAGRRAHRPALECQEVLDKTRKGMGLALRSAPFAGKCLSRSLLLWWLLRRQGVQSELRIGVRKQDGHFRAHAWVEYRGQVLGDVADVARGFSPFSSLPTPPGIARKENASFGAER